MSDETHTIFDNGDERIRAALKDEADAILPDHVAVWPVIEERLKSQTRKKHLPLGRKLILRVSSIALFLLLISVLIYLLLPAHPVTADEIMDRSALNSTQGLDEGEVLYEQYSVRIPMAGTAEGWINTVELWQSFVGDRIRVEVTRSDHVLVMFSMRNKDELWQSVHYRPPISTEVSAILYVPVADEAITYPRTVYGTIGPRVSHSPFRKGILYALPEIDQLIRTHLQACSGISCLLRALDDTEGSLEPRLREEAEETSTVHIIDLYDPARLEPIGTLKIDAENFTFLEYIDQLGSVLNLHERNILMEDELPSDFFASVPEGIRILTLPGDWQPDLVDEEDKTDRIWVVSTMPEPGGKLEDELEVTVGYELVTRPLNTLRILLMPDFSSCVDQPDDCAHGPAGGAQTIIAAGEGTVTLKFPLESWNMHGHLVLMGEIEGNKTVQFFEEYVWEGN